MTLFNEYLINEYGGGQYFTPEENELFKERTYDSLKELEKLGWKVEWEQPSFSGTLYRLWNDGRSRVLYLSEKKLFQGKATIGKLQAAQNRLKILRHRGAPKEEIFKQGDIIAAISKELRASEEYGDLFESRNPKKGDVFVRTSGPSKGKDFVVVKVGTGMGSDKYITLHLKAENKTRDIKFKDFFNMIDKGELKEKR